MSKYEVISTLYIAKEFVDKFSDNLSKILDDELIVNDDNNSVSSETIDKINELSAILTEYALGFKDVSQGLNNVANKNNNRKFKVKIKKCNYEY